MKTQIQAIFNSYPIHSILKFVEKQMVFVLMIVALIAFTISYAYAQTPDLAIAQTTEVAPSTDLIYPEGDTEAYNCIDFTATSPAACLSAYKLGTFSRQDIAITEDGATSTTDNTFYQYSIDLAQPASAATWYVDGSAEKITVNGQSSEEGINLGGATNIKIKWQNGAIKRLSHTPGSTTSITVDPAVASSLFVIPVVANVKVGGTLQLIATGLDETGSPIAISPVWTASTPDIATITNDGLLTGIKAGPVTVTVTANGITASATITVMPEGLPRNVLPVSPVLTPITPTAPLATIPQVISPTDPNAPVLVTPTVPASITDTKTKALLDELATAITNQVKTDSVSETIETTVDTLYTPEAIAQRYLLTGSILPTREEQQLAIDAQSTPSTRFATKLALTSKAVTTTISSTLLGKEILDSQNQTVVTIPNLFERIVQSISGLFQ